MGTISSAFSIVSGALNADQEALNVVANNVANANTPGYTVENPNWQENQPVYIQGQANGTGVTETGATSQRDRVLEGRLDQQQQAAASSSSRLTALNSVQALFVPDSGSASGKAGDIGSDLTSFFGSFASLEVNPGDNSLREEVLSTASMLSADVSGASSSLNSQRGALDEQVSGVTSQVNALTSALAQVNKQIESTSPNADAGTLEDERQQDLSKLSQLIGINQITSENNGLVVTTTGGQLLVAGDTSLQMTSGAISGVTHFFVGTTDITAQLTSGGGQLGGLLTARDQDIPNVLNSLDQLAYNVSTQINSLNNSGVGMNGARGTATNPLYIFNQPSTVNGAAGAMTVTMSDPDLIAAATSGQGSGDNTNATAMANLATQQIVNGQTPVNFYSNFVSSLGATISGVQTENTAQNASVTQLQTQNNSLSSVNLNDEASAMSTLQTSYQAASQVFNILDGIIKSALNLGEQTPVS